MRLAADVLRADGVRAGALRADALRVETTFRPGAFGVDALRVEAAVRAGAFRVAVLRDAVLWAGALRDAVLRPVLPLRDAAAFRRVPAPAREPWPLPPAVAFRAVFALFRPAALVGALLVVLVFRLPALRAGRRVVDFAIPGVLSGSVPGAS